MEEPSLVSVRRRKPSAGTEHLAESAGANRADSSRPSGDHVAPTRGQLRRLAGIRLQLSAGHRPNSAPGRESPARAALWSTSHGYLTSPGRYLTSPGPAPAGDTDRGLRSSSPQTRHAWAGCVESLLRPADDLSPQNLIRGATVLRGRGYFNSCQVSGHSFSESVMQVMLPLHSI